MEISRLRKKEKQAIKSCKLLLNGDISLHILDDDGGTAYAGEVKLYNDDLETVLNLVETQAKELEKKDKMIELMGKLLYEHRNFFGWYEVGIDIESVEKQIEYFEREVENGNTNTEIG